MNILSGIKITKVAAAAEAATTDINSSAVDMSGFDGVLFLTTLHVANAGNTISASQDSITAMTNAATLAGTKVTCIHADDILALDVFKPLKQFVRCDVARGASSACSEIFAIQYNANVKPTDNVVADLIASVSVISPAEGTI